MCKLAIIFLRIHQTKLKKINSVATIKLILRKCGNNSTTNKGENQSKNGKTNCDETENLLEEPTNCCMSGCANCVWVTYAEQLTKQMQDSGEKARAAIMEKVTDPNIRAFLLTELKSLEKK